MGSIRVPAAFLEQDALRLQVGSNVPFLLHGYDAWLVESGYVDVFCARLDGDRVAGVRTHLFRVHAAQLMLPITTAGGGFAAVGLLAVGADGAELLRFPARRLWEASGARAELDGLIAGWVSLLYTALCPLELPSLTAEIEAGTSRAYDQGVALVPGQGVLWISHQRGSSRLLGHPAMRISAGDCLPLARRSWLEPESEVQLDAVGAASDLEPRQVQAAIGLLHDFMLRLSAQRLERIESEQQERIVRMAAARGRAYRGGWLNLAHVMRPFRGTPRQSRPEAEAEADALLAACRLVGDHLGIRITGPRQVATLAQSRRPVLAIAAASRIRVRAVSLREGWWRQDGGPLLGWSAQQGHPLALLPRGPGRYVALDPTTGEERHVDAAVAATISPSAYSFYRGFGDQPLTLRRIFGFGVRRCARDITSFILLSGAAALLSLFGPVATALVFNAVIPNADRAQLVQIVVLLLAVAGATALFSVASSVALLRIEAKLSGDLMAAVWDRLLALPARFFRSFSAGNLASRAMAIESIRQILSVATMSALVTGTMALFQFAFLFHVSSTLALISAALIGTMAVITWVTGYVQLRYQRAITALQARLSGIVLQLLTNIGKIRVAGAEPHAFALWARSFAEQRRLQYRVRFVSNVLRTFQTSFPLFASIVLFAAAAPLVSDGGVLRTGDVIAFLAAFGTAATGMVTVSATFVSVLGVIPYHEQLKPILHGTPEITAGKLDPGALRGNIAVEHVTFQYDENAPPILRDLTIRVAASEFVALVGPSGSGKSTILRILLGFERPTSGAVYYDGQDLASLDVGAVRGQIGVVLQGAQPLPGDIFSNIVGSSGATLEEAWEAARMAGLDEDLKRMPMGMFTVIGEGSSTLSGGQRQRLMIARALVRRPKILLLDEATSALDNATQAAVSASLERLKVTRIVIAHRLSTIVRADRIYVIMHGQVVQAGTYNELMDTDGPFADLAKRQLL